MVDYYTQTLNRLPRIFQNTYAAFTPYDPQMNSLVYQHFHRKIEAFGRKLITSLAVVENASTYDDKHVQILTQVNPIEFLNEFTKSKEFTANDTKIIHAQFLKTHVLDSDIFVSNSLVGLYCKSAAVGYALRLFETIRLPNAVSWNVIISFYNQNSLFEQSWRMFCRMHSMGFDSNQITYGSILSACSALQDSFYGMQVYALATKNGFFSDGYVRAGMIDLFTKSCSFEDALKVFYDVSCENVVCWNAIISGAVKNKEYRVALKMFLEMCSGLLLPNSFTFSSVLTACAALEELELGKGVQGWVTKFGATDVFVQTAVVDLYVKCGCMNEAVKEFLQISTRNVVSWTAIISGFVRNGDNNSAIQFFKQLRNLGEDMNNYTVTSVLSACSNPAMVSKARQIHCWILKTGFYLDSTVQASLINMYSRTGDIGLSEILFGEAQDLKHLGTWAVMMSAFAQNGCSERAINLFQKMLLLGLRPDKFCCSSVLSVISSLQLGRQLHSYTRKVGLVFDMSVGSSLFTMYSKCGSLQESYEIFYQMVDKDKVSWASMIAGFAEHGYADQAIKLCREMLSENVMPDETTLKAVLTACSTLQFLKAGKEIHGYAVHRGDGRLTLVGSALINMYSKCGALQLARRVFDMIPVKDQASWSSLMAGYAQSGYIRKALQLFHEMLMAGLDIDSFTISSVLGAVTLLNRSSGVGAQLQAWILKIGLESDAAVGSSLIMMYSKCGHVDDCSKAFEEIGEPDLVSWTAMIASYAQHGKGAEALRIYDLMRKSGIKPDSVTFIGVLSACSHSGLVEDGYFHLNSMIKDYGIEPGYRHYACMVDLLGRSGRLKEAEHFINRMPIRPDALVWGTLLAACKVHGDVELARLAAEKVKELEPSDSGAYVSLSNICADVGQWEQVLNIRAEMKGSRVNKDPGWSYV